jgi:hypothetical protein
MLKGSGRPRPGHKEDTVIHYARLAGRHAKALHEQLLAFSPAHPGTAAG